MLLASCGAEIKFHKWPCGDYYGSFRVTETGFYIPSISWCCEGKLLATTMPSPSPPTILTVDQGIQSYLIINLPHVQAITFSRTIQKNIVLGTDIGQVLVYDVQEQNIIKQFPTLPSSVKYLQYSAKDESLAAGCKNGQICIFNNANNFCATFCVPNCTDLTAMAFHSQQSHMLAAAGGEVIVSVWNSNTGNATITEKKHDGCITDLAFSSRHDMVTAGLDQKFNGYDLRTMKAIFTCITDSQLSAVSFMPVEDTFVVASTYGKIYCYDNRRINYPIQTINVHHPKAISRIAFQTIPTLEEPFENHKSLNKATIETIVQNTKFIKVDDSESESQISAPKNCSVNYENAQFTAELDYFNKRYIQYSSDSNTAKQFNSMRTECPSIPKQSTCVNLLNKISLDKIKNNVISEYKRKQPCCSYSSKIIDVDDDFTKMNKYLTDVVIDMTDKLIDLVNKEVLRIRMALSKRFIQMECKMNARWEEFNNALMEVARSDITYTKITDKSHHNVNSYEVIDEVEEEDEPRQFCFSNHRKQP